MTIIPCQQRTPEWHQARLGRLTGSRVADAFATLKSGKGEAAGRRNLRTQLVLERLTGESQEHGFVSPAMDRGAALEVEACAAYEAQTGILVEPVGFLVHDEMLAGYSPDGMTEDGLIEIKCPMASAHLDYLCGGVPQSYYLQIVHGLWLTGRTWADFVSYHPTFPALLRLKVTRVTVTEAERAAHELMVRAFLAEVDQEYAAVAALAVRGIA